VKAMQDISRKIFNEKTLINVEKDIVKVAEVFRLTNMEEMKTAEKKYFPPPKK
jgi:phosphoenolpyruvate phosphomutase